jgi:4-hydroxy 2-oxovalerate aldolase
MIDPTLRQRYDYDNIEKVYIQYNNTKVDDNDARIYLKNVLTGKPILLILPGKSIIENRTKIDKLIEEIQPVIISVNFVFDSAPKDNLLAFFGGTKRYKKFAAQRENVQVVITSNITSDCDTDIILNYESLIERGSNDFENTMILLLNLLKKLSIHSFYIAGFDGFSEKNNFIDNVAFEEDRIHNTFKSTNENLTKILKHYVDGLEHPEYIKFVTPSIYESLFTRNSRASFLPHTIMLNRD